MSTTDDMAMFVAVADAGSMTRAGERLGLSPAVVSKRLANLEAHLGGRLLNRTTRRVALTDEGRSLAPNRRVLCASPACIAARGRPAHAADLHAVYPHRRGLSPKARVWIDYLAEKYGPVPYWEGAR